MNFAETVEHNLKGLKFVSTGLSSGCEICAKRYGYTNEDGEVDIEKFKSDYEVGEVLNEGSFSWNGCGICRSSLGGHRFIWHYVDEDNEIVHKGDCCVDCLCYINNGQLPEE